MERRNFLKLMGCASLSFAVSCSPLYRLSSFPFGTPNENYQKKYLASIEDLVVKKRDYYKTYFRDLDRYLELYSKQPLAYRVKHESDLYKSLKPLTHAITDITKQSLEPLQITLAHEKSPYISKKILYKSLFEKYSGINIYNQVILKSSNLTLATTSHEIGHYLDNKVNHLIFLLKDKHEIQRSEMAAESCAIYLGNAIAFRWDKKIGKKIITESYDRAEDGLMHDLRANTRLETLIQKGRLYPNADMFDFILLDYFNYDTALLWDFLRNNSKKTVFKKLRSTIKKHGSIIKAVETSLNKSKTKFNL
ncbi:MAG: hypothetical protein U9Q69_03750 [Nanoarchaeota archaeon]|nr:hypothetical protein [Nanoarchaeota archaeon]